MARGRPSTRMAELDKAGGEIRHGPSVRAVHRFTTVQRTRRRPDVSIRR
jgi:hypothetical protein